jgi:hypothetical protein
MKSLVAQALYLYDSLDTAKEKMMNKLSITNPIFDIANKLGAPDIYLFDNSRQFRHVSPYIAMSVHHR